MPCYENFRNIYSKLHQSKYNRVTGNKFYVLLYRENGLKSNIPELLWVTLGGYLILSVLYGNEKSECNIIEYRQVMNCM